MKTSAFSQSFLEVEGNFLGFIPRPGNEFKYMRLQVAERILSLKISKKLRFPLSQSLVEGDRLRVALKAKGKLKLKAERVEKISECELSCPLPCQSPSSSKGNKILICRKSSCSKRGGKKLHSALEDTLKQLGLYGQIGIQLTGCQKQCKKAPSLTLMPGKVKHTYVDPDDLSSLISQHYRDN
ncbi:MAG: (2Fe-2S) ferredoxin domain-containing protein [Spirulinaceae cyanobacterium]